MIEQAGRNPARLWAGSPLTGSILFLLHPHMRGEHAALEGNDLIPLVITALCEYGPTPINPMNPIDPIKVWSPDDAEMQFLTADITIIIKELTQIQENGPSLEAISAKRVG